MAPTPSAPAQALISTCGVCEADSPTRKALSPLPTNQVAIRAAPRLSIAEPQELFGPPRKPIHWSLQKCEHGKQWRFCQHCDGRSLCEHGRPRHRCKEGDCHGTGICKHKRDKHNCKDCRGNGMCEHGRQKCRCMEGDCPARRLNARAGKGRWTDEEIMSALILAPPCGHRYRSRGGARIRWPMGFPTSAAAISVAMRERSSVRMCDWPWA